MSALSIDAFDALTDEIRVDGLLPDHPEFTVYLVPAAARLVVGMDGREDVRAVCREAFVRMEGLKEGDSLENRMKVWRSLVIRDKIIGKLIELNARVASGEGGADSD